VNFKLSSKTLAIVSEAAKVYYRDLNKPVDLSDGNFVAYCYFLAIQDAFQRQQLLVKYETDWQRKYTGSDDEF